MDADALAGLTAMFTLVGGFVGLILLLLMLRAIFTLEPRQAVVLLYWGKFRRTVDTPGFHFASPIGLRKVTVYTRDTVIALPVTTVVEAHGNPIQVSAVVVYRIVDARKAIIDNDNYHAFVQNQASAALKAVCSRFPYEEEDPSRPDLKSESQVVIGTLTQELQRQVDSAGVRIVLVRLNDLTYAPEIAQSMLLRQQAQAMVDARRTVVRGAVDTVRDALAMLKQAGVPLSPDRRTRLASNLTLLLCAGERGDSHSTVVSRAR